MQLEERIVRDVIIVKVTGEITLKKAGDVVLHDRVRNLIQQGHRKVLFDLASVSYVDSAGLGELVQAYSTIRNYGGSLKLFNPTKRLHDLLVVTDLARLFDRYDDEAQALASFGAQQA
jgi:anti-sigma B factor antagonist